MRKIGLWTVVAVMLGALLASCGNSNDSNGDSANTASHTPGSASNAGTTSEPALSGKIVFANHLTNITDTKLKDLAAAFTSLHPGTTIEIEPIKDVATEMKTRMAANELPDISEIPQDIPKADYPKYYLPLDYLGYTADTLIFHEAGVVDGKLYKVIGGVNYDGITYSKAAFRAAGIDKTPTTLDELYAVGEKLKAAGITPMATNFKEGWPPSVCSNLYTYDKSGDSNIRNVLMESGNYFSGPNIEGLDVLRTLKAKGLVDPDLIATDWTQTQIDMAQGKFGMTYLANWYVGALIEHGAKPEDVGMFPFPETVATAVQPDFGFGIAANTKNPELAKAFLKFMFEDNRYEQTAGLKSPVKSSEPSGDPAIAELTSFGLPFVELTADEDKVNQVLNKAQIDISRFAQEYLLADDPQAVADSYNKKFNDTLAALDK